MKLLVNIDVPDISVAERFYTSAFELKVDRRFGNAALELVGLECRIYLLAKGSGTPPFDGAVSGRSYDRHWSPVHLDFEVDDLETALARAETAGAKRESEIQESKWGKMVFLSDPFGHGFCLLKMKPGGYDNITTARGE
jgi:lactoylglutathione lyase